MNIICDVWECDHLLLYFAINVWISTCKWKLARDAEKIEIFLILILAILEMMFFVYFGSFSKRQDYRNKG